MGCVRLRKMCGDFRGGWSIWHWLARSFVVTTLLVWSFPCVRVIHSSIYTHIPIWKSFTVSREPCTRYACRAHPYSTNMNPIQPNRIASRDPIWACCNESGSLEHSARAHGSWTKPVVCTSRLPPRRVMAAPSLRCGVVPMPTFWNQNFQSNPTSDKP